MSCGGEFPGNKNKSEVPDRTKTITEREKWRIKYLLKPEDSDRKLESKKKVYNRMHPYVHTHMYTGTTDMIESIG